MKKIKSHFEGIQHLFLLDAKRKICLINFYYLHSNIQREEDFVLHTSTHLHTHTHTGLFLNMPSAVRLRQLISTQNEASVLTGCGQVPVNLCKASEKWSFMTQTEVGGVGPGGGGVERGDGGRKERD